MDLPRQTFRCGPPWWSLLPAVLLSIALSAYLSEKTWQYRHTLVLAEGEEWFSDSRGYLFGTSAAVAVLVAIGLLAGMIGRRVCPGTVLLGEKSVEVPLVDCLPIRTQVDYAAINDVRFHDRPIMPGLVIQHRQGVTRVDGSRFRRERLRVLYDELGVRVRKACAEEAVV